MNNRKSQIGERIVTLVVARKKEVFEPTQTMILLVESRTDDDGTVYANYREFHYPSQIEEAELVYETKVKDLIKRYEESIQNTPRRSAIIT